MQIDLTPDEAQLVRLLCQNWRKLLKDLNVAATSETNELAEAVTEKIGEGAPWSGELKDE